MVLLLIGYCLFSFYGDLLGAFIICISMKHFSLMIILKEERIGNVHTIRRRHFVLAFGEKA